MLAYFLSVLWSTVQSALLHLAESEQKVHFRTHPVTSVFCRALGKQQWASASAAMRAHAITQPPSDFTEDLVCFAFWAGPVRLDSTPRCSHLSRDCSSRARLPPSEPFHQVWFGLSIFEADVRFSPCVNPLCSLSWSLLFLVVGHRSTYQPWKGSCHPPMLLPLSFLSSQAQQWVFFPQNIPGW